MALINQPRRVHSTSRDKDIACYDSEKTLSQSVQKPLLYKIQKYNPRGVKQKQIKSVQVICYSAESHIKVNNLELLKFLLKVCVSHSGGGTSLESFHGIKSQSWI